MPEMVPEAKPPRPSASSHSTLGSKLDDILDPCGAAKEKILVRFDGEATGDESSNGVGPAILESSNVTDRGFERVATGVYSSKDDLILQHEIAHHQVRVDLYRALAAGDSGEDEDAVGTENLHHGEGEARCAGRLVYQVDVSHPSAKHFDGVAL